MKILRSISAAQKYIQSIKSKHQTIGFVPTMGALHEGHLLLAQKARRENDIVAASIFINPKQFGPSEDFKKYPRQTRNDSLLLNKEKVDVVFYPTEKMMYPRGYLTYIDVGLISQSLCGKFRPEHFRGVATVVAKLINIIQPDRMYLGLKDAQQVVVIKRLVTDLNFSTQVVTCPTVRESDGLALSSRNMYLTVDQRKEAVVLWRSLCLAKKMIKDGEKKSQIIINAMQKFIQQNSSGNIQYIECVDVDTLEKKKSYSSKMLIAIAVYFGSTRLIDNIIV